MTAQVDPGRSGISLVPGDTDNLSDLDTLRDRAWMAKRIGKTEDWIAHNMGRIPHIKLGRTVHFTERLALEFLEAATRRPVSGQSSRSIAAMKRRRGMA